MRGEISSGKFAKRHPLDWYVEEQWVTRQLIDALGGFGVDRAAGIKTIWDPAAGMGNIPASFHDIERRTLLSDVVNRVAWDNFGGAAPARFFSADFQDVAAAPEPCSIVCNPPYSYCKGHGDYAGLLISEAFARHAIKLVRECGGTYVCMVLPVKWLGSQGRYRLFTEFPPSAVLHLTQRPSMPPGDRIAEMGNRAFQGGMVDYCWIVWDVRHPASVAETRTIWLPPLGQPVAVAPLPGLSPQENA